MSHDENWRTKELFSRKEKCDVYVRLISPSECKRRARGFSNEKMCETRKKEYFAGNKSRKYDWEES